MDFSGSSQFELGFFSGKSFSTGVEKSAKRERLGARFKKTSNEWEELSLPPAGRQGMRLNFVTTS